MQQRALFLFALLFAPAAASSLSTARAWLQSHKSPTDDQLGELQASNPAAFAIVNALLSKHKKGEIKLSSEERGPDVFRKMMTPRHLSSASNEPSVALPYASEEVQPAMVDNAHYNPKSAADKDENMVDKLLGAVAGLAGDKGKKIALLRQRRHKKTQEDNALEKDADLFEAATPAPVQAVVEMPEIQEQEPAASSPKPHENAYLKGIDLSGDMPQVEGAKAGKTTPVSEGADLEHFSFGDAAPAVATPAPKKVAPPQPKKENAFLKYLGFVKKAPIPKDEPEQAALAKPMPKQNPYLTQSLLD